MMNKKNYEAILKSEKFIFIWALYKLYVLAKICVQ